LINNPVKKIYLDHNATTPVLPEVVEFVKPFFSDFFGNPSSIHWAGRDVRVHYDNAREHVASMVNAKPEEIVFTGCGSESDNHAIKGVAFSRKSRGNHIITTAIEHPAVLNTCRYLETVGYRVTYLPVDQDGQIEPDDVRKAIEKETILISVMYANNETGNLLPIREIGAIAREHDVIFHSDMVQALGKIAIDVDSLNVDLASFAGHKVYAPKGVGVLYIRQGLDIENLIHGGHQEGGRRAGTENVIGAIAFGKANEIISHHMDEENKRIDGLRQKLLEGILERIDHVKFNGHRTHRLPNTLNLSFEFVEAESLLIALDLKGIAVSSGSACSSGSGEPSHVLRAMDIPVETCLGTIRLSLGRSNTEEDLDYTLSVLPEIVARLRAMSPLYRKK
jgi:cysteine desulfurase